MGAQTAGWLIFGVLVIYRPQIGRSKLTGTVEGTYRAVTEMSGLLADVER